MFYSFVSLFSAGKMTQEKSFFPWEILRTGLIFIVVMIMIPNRVELDN
jgi:hypothetical protein